MEINNRWKAETDKYYMRLFREFYDESNTKYYEFVVETKKLYSKGNRFQIFNITEGFIDNEPEDRLIEMLSGEMDDIIDLLISEGEIKECDQG